MATYTQLNPDEIQKLAEHYNLQISDCAPLNGGNGNSSYLIKVDQASYVLTVCDDKTFDEVIKMGQLLVLLKQHKIPCNRLIPTQNGGILTTYSTAIVNKAVMLKEYIQGEVVEHLDKLMLFEIGKQAAQLNEVTAPNYLPTNHPYGLHLFSKVIGLSIDPEYEAWIAKEIEYLQQHLSDDLPRGLIHGDLFFDNLLFDDTSSGWIFKAIIDFEEACHYYSVFELGMAAIGTCVDDGTRVNLEKVRALVAGYQQIRSLQLIEKQSLQLFIRYAAVATSYWRFNKYNIEEADTNKTDHHWQMVQMAKAISDMPTKQFMTEVF
jgi:homoserine kinase type II